MDGLTATISVPTAATALAQLPIRSVIDHVVLGLMIFSNMTSDPSLADPGRASGTG
jgi:hypothetical protein